jgi:hypothetical protein
MEFNFILKDNNQRIFRRFVWFLFFLHVLAAGIIALSTTDRKMSLSVNVLLGFYALVLTGYYFLRKTHKAFDTFSLILALLYANFWLKQVGILALLAFLILYLFVLVVQGRKTTVQVTATGVSVTRVFKTTFYNWVKIDNLVLKDNLLTIDLSTNKIIQAEIIDPAGEAEEISFNAYCDAQLKTVQQNGTP